MATLDYQFVQGMIDFGRTLASNMIGQPFAQYRLSPTHSGNLLDAQNQIGNLNAKVTATNSRIVIENQFFHVNVFEFLIAASSVQLGDILVQQDQAFGQNANYAVASFRPLKPVLAVRVNHLSTLWRLNTEYNATTNPGGYSGVGLQDELPFVLTNGIFQPASSPTVPPTQVPCGIVSTGELRGLAGQVERMPLDTMRALWFGYLPELPGLARLRPGDVIQGPAPDTNEIAQRFAVQNVMQIPAGFAGTFYSLELLVP